jgi:hypothetical protein
MPKDVVVPSLTLQPQSQPALSSQICAQADSGTPLCLYSHEMVSLILAVAVLVKAIALLVKALRGSADES